MKNNSSKKVYSGLLILVLIYELLNSIYKFIVGKNMNMYFIIENAFILFLTITILVLFLYNLRFFRQFLLFFLILQILKYVYGIVYALIFNSHYGFGFSQKLILKACIILLFYILIIYNRKKIRL